MLLTRKCIFCNCGNRIWNYIFLVCFAKWISNQRGHRFVKKNARNAGVTVAQRIGTKGFEGGCTVKGDCRNASGASSYVNRRKL